MRESNARDPESIPRLERGVWEDPSVPAGYRQLRMIAGDGTELVSLRIHERAENTDPVPRLRAWLDEVDPAKPKLTLV